MIQIDISKALAKPLARHLKPARTREPDLLWRADLAAIGSEPCIVAQEQYSHYVMVLCGLGGEEFAQFPQLLRERFCREAVAICKQAGLYSDATLASHILKLFDQQHYQLDPEPVEEGAITRVFEKLERQFLYERRPLPTDGRAAFQFSFQINSRQPNAREDSVRLSAAETIGNLCLNMIENRLREEELQSPVVSEVDNIVRVDFARQRGQ